MIKKINTIKTSTKTMSKGRSDNFDIDPVEETVDKYKKKESKIFRHTVPFNTVYILSGSKAPMRITDIVRALQEFFPNYMYDDYSAANKSVTRCLNTYNKMREDAEKLKKVYKATDNIDQCKEDHGYSQVDSIFEITSKVLGGVICKTEDDKYYFEPLSNAPVPTTPSAISNNKKENCIHIHNRTIPSANLYYSSSKKIS